MPEEILTLVKIPIAEIEEWIRAKHVLPRVLTDFHVEENTLYLYFGEGAVSEKQEDSASSRGIIRKKRRARRKRNRMKTRGWEIVARMTNSKGQKCAIYKPFMDALRESKLTVEEQKAVVKKILRSNRNKPSAGSIQYFLENTLEYLAGQQVQNSSQNEQEESV